MSCSSAVRWQKAGVSAADQRRDETECTSLANCETSVPSASTVGSGAATGTPYDPQRSRLQTYDVAAFEECMRTRGYEWAPARP